MTDSTGATDPAALLASVADLLRAERVEIASSIPSPPLIATVFDVEGQRVPVLVFPNATRDYLILAGLVISPLGDHHSVHLDALPADKLRAIIRTHAEVPLARVEFGEMDGKPLWAATSQCSTREMTGIKIRRRLEDCARLAHKLGQLLTPEQTTALGA